MVLALIALLMVIFTVLVWQNSWTSPPHYTGYGTIDLPVPIMTAMEYGAVISTHPRPYIFQVSAGTGAVLLYGAEHTKDPADVQIRDLQERWKTFGPSVALVEGRMGFLPPFVADPVRQFGESGAVYGLARNANIQAYTWELPLDREIAIGLSAQSRERVALFFVLRPYFSNLRHGRPADPEGFVEEYRRKRTKWPGLENTLDDIAAIDAIWQRDFPETADWRDTSDREGLPGYLGEIAVLTNAERDEHFARAIIDLVRKGRRVFAVAGSSHAVKLEPAIRGALMDGR